MNEKIRQLLPNKVYDELLSLEGFDTPLRLAHFLSQCAHESQNFQRVEENLNYSAERLLQVFPKYFNDKNVAQYARNGMAIASRVYANRMGNGNEAGGDGWFYRGRGYLQLTGHDNYAAFDVTIADDILLNPHLVASDYPLRSAAWFWMKNNINRHADANNIEAVTRAVNDGLNGLDDRIKYFDRFYNVL